jgi:hypothetical protein
MKAQLILLFGILFFCSLSCDNKDELKLLPVELISPVSGATEQPLNAILAWEDPNTPGNYTYDILLGKTAENLQLVDTMVAYSNDPDYLKYECKALDKSTKYYGKVRVRKDGKSQESEIFEFTTTDRLTSFPFQDRTVMVYPTAYRYEYPDSLIQYSQLVPSGALSWTDGSVNTQSLLADFETYPLDGFHINAKYCSDLNAYGYTDWYLPAIEELDSVLRKHFWLYSHTKEYWSSTEDQTYPMFAYYSTYTNPEDTRLTYQTQNKSHGDYCFCVRSE